MPIQRVYQWPQTRDGYFVAKPPQMAYVTSFDGKLACPDPVTAELVPWSTEGLDPQMVEFLDMAYRPHKLDMQVSLRLTHEQFAGPNAFDVSSDGSRLVLIDDEGLAMYKTEDGTLVGHLALPDSVSSPDSPATAVRFCGNTMDMLVASNDRIVRISSKDASVTGEAKGCGEPIADWIVTENDQAMLIRSESGRLFGGDSQLEVFAAYNLGKDVVFDAASLSPDGTRIGVLVNSYPRTYIQDDFHIVDEIDYQKYSLDPTVSIVCGWSSDAWADADGLVYTTPNQDGTRSTGGYQMLWKPIQISMATDTPNVNYLLTVGKRFIDGAEQYVMFSFGPIGRGQSLPHRLDELPIRYAHSLTAHRVAIADSKGLRVCKRDAFRMDKPAIFETKIYDWVDAKKFAEFERLLAIIKSQDRLGFGLTSAELCSYVINMMAARWMYLNDNDPDGDLIKGLEAWRDEGSQLSIVVNGIRHHRHAWNTRGRGNPANRTAWETYSGQLENCIQELALAVEMDSPAPLVAYETLIGAKLESTGSIDVVDGLCRRATELYPTEIEPHYSVCFKLLPRWHGEQGDALSFALSVSKMFEGAEADYKYVRLVSKLCNKIRYSSSVEWRSYDSMRIRRGLQECIRRQASTGDDLWLLWMQFSERTADKESADQVLRHLMANRAVAPYVFTDGSYIHVGRQMRSRSEVLRRQ